ncbi:MAG: hypothetical protein ACRCWF_05520 [Beijerinckiaceae bacterium]
MSKTETTNEPKAKRAKRDNTPVKPVNRENPFYVVLHQTEARNVMTIHEGAQALEDARAEAARRALSSKCVAYVIGPQRSFASPPNLTVAEETQLDFSA